MFLKLYLLVVLIGILTLPCDSFENRFAPSTSHEIHVVPCLGGPIKVIASTLHSFFILTANGDVYQLPKVYIHSDWENVAQNYFYNYCGEDDGPYLPIQQNISDMKIQTDGDNYVLALSSGTDILLIENGITSTTLSDVLGFEFVDTNRWIYFNSQNLVLHDVPPHNIITDSSIAAISHRYVLFDNGSVGHINDDFTDVTLDSTLENIIKIKSTLGNLIAAREKIVYHKGFDNSNDCDVKEGEYCKTTYAVKITAIQNDFNNIMIGFVTGYLQHGDSIEKISNAPIDSIQRLNSVIIFLDGNNENQMLGSLSTGQITFQFPPFKNNPLHISLELENEEICGTIYTELATLDQEGRIWFRNMLWEVRRFMINDARGIFDTFDAARFMDSWEILVKGNTLFHKDKKFQIPLDSDDKVKSIAILDSISLLLVTEKGVMIYDTAIRKAIVYDKTVQVQVIYNIMSYTIIKVNKAYYCVGTNNLCSTTNEYIFESYTYCASTGYGSCKFGRMTFLLNARRAAFSLNTYMFVTNDFELFGLGNNMYNMFRNNHQDSYVPVPMNIGPLEGVAVCNVYGPFDFAFFVEACDGRIFIAGSMRDQAIKKEGTQLIAKDYKIEAYALFEGYKIHRAFSHLGIHIFELNELPPSIPDECYISSCTVEEDATIDNGVVLTNNSVIIIKSNTTIVDSSVVILNPGTGVTPIVVDGGTIVLNNTELIYKVDTQDLYEAIKDGLVIPIISTENNGSIQGDFSDVILEMDPSLNGDCRLITATAKSE